MGNKVVKMEVPIGYKNDYLLNLIISSELYQKEKECNVKSMLFSDYCETCNSRKRYSGNLKEYARGTYIYLRFQKPGSSKYKYFCFQQSDETYLYLLFLYVRKMDLYGWCNFDLDFVYSIWRENSKLDHAYWYDGKELFRKVIGQIKHNESVKELPDIEKEFEDMVEVMYENKPWKNVICEKCPENREGICKCGKINYINYPSFEFYLSDKIERSIGSIWIRDKIKSTETRLSTKLLDAVLCSERYLDYFQLDKHKELELKICSNGNFSYLYSKNYLQSIDFIIKSYLLYLKHNSIFQDFDVNNLISNIRNYSIKGTKPCAPEIEGEEGEGKMN